MRLSAQRLPELVDFGAIGGGAGGDFRDVDFESVPVNTLWRHVVTPPAPGRPGGVQATELLKRVVEFPRVDPRRFGK